MAMYFRSVVLSLFSGIETRESLKEIRKEKKSSPKSGGQKSHPCEDERNLAKSECQKLYLKWREEKEKALMNGAKSFPDFKTWLRSQPPSPAMDDEG